MPSCCFCFSEFTEIKSYFTHMKLLHINETYFKCIENNCCRNFSNYASFKKHIISHNKDSLISPKAIVHTVSVDNLINNNCDDSSTNISEPFYAENMLNQTNSDDNHKILNMDSTLKELIDEKVLLFITHLYADATLCRKDVQTIIDGVLDIYTEPLGLAKDMILQMVNPSNISESDKTCIFNYLSELQNAFKGFHSEYYRFKVLRSTTNYLDPIEYIVGQRFDKIKDIGLPKSYTAQMIPIAKVLKKFFELPDVLNETLKYIKTLLLQKEISNIIQTDTWRQKIKDFPSDCYVFPIFIYFDEYETGNPLGSHAGIHKLGAIYFSIPCIPQKYLAQIENIFLGLLFHGDDLKEFGIKNIFSKFIVELISLEKHGIEINVSSTDVKKIYFCVSLFLGDNLGLNTLLGFVGSFRANFFLPIL